MFLTGVLTFEKDYTIQPWVKINKTKSLSEKTPDAKLPMITIMEINLPIVYAFDLSTQELSFHISHFIRKSSLLL